MALNLISKQSFVLHQVTSVFIFVNGMHYFLNDHHSQHYLICTAIL